MSSNYYLLGQQGPDDAENPPLGWSFRHSKRSHSVFFVSIQLLLLISLFGNAIHLYQQLHPQTCDLQETSTEYARLTRNLSTAFVLESPYTSSNQTLQDAAWSSPDLLPDTGMVALEDTWSKSKSLAPAQRFPWDHSKGLYFLNGFHNLHCLHILRRYIFETFAHTKPTSDQDHIIHCLNVLREEIMCNADDTPRYTGRLNAEMNAKHPISGIGQVRMCKDWGQLRRWAVYHSACYRAIHAGEEGFPPIERYKYCPGGERPWE